MLKETLLSQGNGYLGSRGTLEEGDSAIACEGVYLNGLYSAEAIVYGESAYGFAEQNHKMLQVPSGKWFRLQLDGEWLHPQSGQPMHRHLDLQNGVLQRSEIYQTSSGKQLRFSSERLVSAAIPGLMLLRFELEALNFSGDLLIETALDARYQPVRKAGDPRVGDMSARHALAATAQCDGQLTALSSLQFNAQAAPFQVAALMHHQWPEDAVLLQSKLESHWLSQQVQLSLTQGVTQRVEKWLYYGHSDRQSTTALLLARLEAEFTAQIARGSAAIWREHQALIAEFWYQTDIECPADPALQQGMRFNLFSLYQHAGRNGQSNIGAKGLSGPGYDGHYFWDTEIYVVPVLSLCQPQLARQLLQFRINQLPQAQQRAREMSHQQGALYPWRTIGGTECSAYFPAGTAQYHINAAIAYALRSYLLASGDFAFIAQQAAGMLFETARLWLELGFFGRSGAFEIHQVTGPDEYTALVNNNFYTNAMAKLHLQFAVEIWQRLKQEQPAQAQHWAQQLSLDETEIGLWKQAAQQMLLPYDEALHINAQDDSFLQKKPWNFAETPAENYPLLLHYHPLVIYRHQVLKQADVVLAMVLLDQQFSTAQKAKNLAYYEPLTTHDSSLSSCIHSLAYAETGEPGKALHFLRDTLRMDLDNRHHNTEFGVHIACMAGSWLALVNGFAGMRCREDGLHFTPQLPADWPELKFRLTWQGRLLQLRFCQQQTEYQLLSGPALTLWQGAVAISLTEVGEQKTVQNGVQP
ncbi:MAG: glycoside hydrolase family 65 protein [Gammaproteobacteria bacterium]|nr:glycoside hydrolase family 65 protein [Gammaproteobacteria bacterium]